MRPRLFRAPGVLVSVALAIAPNLAWAATPSPSPAPPIRVDLGQRQSATTEARWQPIAQTETVTEPWKIVSSTTRVDRSQPSPQILRYQEVRTDSYSQRATTYPLEAKEERTKTTTTQDYELRSYAVQTSTSTVQVPVVKEIEGQVDITEYRPVTTPVQVLSNEPRLVSKQVPVYKTVTATYSIAAQPLLTPLKFKFRDEKVTESIGEPYNGSFSSYGGTFGNNSGQIAVQADGTTLIYTSSSIFNKRCDVPISFSASPADVHGNLYEWSARISLPSPMNSFMQQEQLVTIRVREVGDHDELDMACVSSYAYATLTLDAHLFRKDVTKTVKVPYVDDGQGSIFDYFNPVTATASFPLQLEKLTNKPWDMQGTKASWPFPEPPSVAWSHYHFPGIACSYAKETVMPGLPTGNVRNRLTSLSPLERSAFTLTTHRTDVMPIFADDATPATFGTRDVQVVDHYETQQVWSSEPHWVTQQVPVNKIVRWDPLPYKMTSFNHTHGDPVYPCTNQYVLTALGNSVTHSKLPVFGPHIEAVVVSVPATQSVTVMEPRIVTSTSSVLVSTVPGQDVSASYSAWAATGEKRRAGTGTAREATRSVDVAGRFWNQGILTTAQNAIAPLKTQTTSYKSDMTSGNTRQAISGSDLRRKLKSSEAISSKPKVVSVGGSIIAPVAIATPRPGTNGPSSGTETSRSGLTLFNK